MKMITGKFYQGQDIEILARIPDPAGTVLVPGDIASYTVDIYDVTEGRGQSSPVYSLSSSISTEVITASLQKDGRWVADKEGYNFLYRVEPETLLPVVLKGSRRYRVEVWLTAAAVPINVPTGAIPVMSEFDLLPSLRKR
jgi:hypothetical protein